MQSSSRGKKHVAFSISAGCYFYQMGIAYYMQKHFDLSEVLFSGASGGSWPATLLASGEDIKQALELLLKYAPDCCRGRLLGAYGVYDIGMKDVYNRIYNGKNVPELVKNRLAISVTRLDLRSPPFFTKDEVISEFTSNDDVIECIVASALIPFALTGKPYVSYRGWICMDGGITNVTGVRRFADALAHDIELLEEEIIEKTSHISENFKDAIKTAENTTAKLNENYHHMFLLHDLPMVSDPYGTLILTKQIMFILLSNLMEMIRYHFYNVNIYTSISNTAYERHNDNSDVVVSSVDTYCNTYNTSNTSITHHSEETYPHTNTTSTTTCSTKTSIASKIICKLSNIFSFNSVGVTAATTTDISLKGSINDSEVLHYLENCDRWPSLSHSTEEEIGLATDIQNSNNEYRRDSISEELKDNCHYIVGATDVSNQERDTFISANEMSAISNNAVINDTTNSTDVNEIVIENKLLIDVICGDSAGSNIVRSDSSSSTIVRSDSSPITPTKKKQLVKSDGFVTNNGETYWAVKGQSIKKTPDGGTLLEISPWMWRQQPVLNYHLTSDMEAGRRLFDMGLMDAAEHHWDLMKFFVPEEYAAMQQNSLKS
jgi:hypothetical protein